MFERMWHGRSLFQHQRRNVINKILESYGVYNNYNRYTEPRGSLLTRDGCYRTCTSYEL